MPAVPVEPPSSDVSADGTDAPVPVRLDTSDDRALEFEDVGSSAFGPALPVRAPASPMSDESWFVSPLVGDDDEPSRPPEPTAVWVFIASVSNDAKSAPVVAPDPAVASVDGGPTVPTCCSIAWMRAWTAAMPEKVIRV